MSYRRNISVHPSPLSGPDSRKVDETFYFEDVYISVENTCFRLWRRNFELGSRVFRDMFSLPSGPNTPEGSSKDYPIVLQGIKVNEFRHLLKILFPRTTDIEESLTTDEWISVLKLSTMWEFLRLKDLAIHNLDGLLSLQALPARRVALARQYDIKAWLIPAFNELAQRESPLTKEDFEAIGLDDFLKLVQVREKYTSGSAGNYIPRENSMGIRSSRYRKFGNRNTGGSSMISGAELDIYLMSTPPKSTGRLTYDFSEHIKTIFEL